MHLQTVCARSNAKSNIEGFVCPGHRGSPFRIDRAYIHLLQYMTHPLVLTNWGLYLEMVCSPDTFVNEPTSGAGPKLVHSLIVSKNSTRSLAVCISIEYIFPGECGLGRIPIPHMSQVVHDHVDDAKLALDL